MPKQLYTPHLREATPTIVDGHYQLPNGVQINLDCLAEDCVHYDKNAPKHKNCDRGFNGSLVVHLWGFCKHYKSKIQIEEKNL
jgi:hypothetical protein